MLRKLIVVASLALALVPMTALAAVPTKSDPVVACIKSASSDGTKTLTKVQVQHCAPAGASILSAGSSYAIAVSSTSQVSTSSSSRTALAAATSTYCGWKTFTVYLVSGITDWLGGYFCWNYSRVWISNGPQASCSAWLPGAGCFYQYKWVDTQPYGQYYIQINADYFQNCVFGFPCNHYSWLGVWNDGGQDNGTNGF